MVIPRVMFCCVLLASSLVLAEDKPVRWIDLNAEYRVQSTLINPLDLNGNKVTRTFWTEQRLRLDLAMNYEDVGKIVMQADVLGGVLFGDNGDYGKDPSPNSGLAITSKSPNRTGWKVGLPQGRDLDPLDPESYAPVLQGIDPVVINYVYGEANIKIGLLRVGRQAMSEGAAISGHDGSRLNRWGVSGYTDRADRVLFATKLDEAVKLIKYGKNHKPNLSTNTGVLFAATYDWNVQDDIYVMSDDAFQTNLMLSWRREKADWLGVEWRDFQLTSTLVHKGSEEFDTAIWALPTRFTAHVGPLYFNLQYSVIFGESREVSEGFSVLSNKKPAVQKILQMGAHALVDYNLGPVTLTMEFDYASGDADPRSDTTLSQFSFARDFNVGLLMFEHILAFQTARSAAVGIENLKTLDAKSFPLTEISSDGRFSNAIALFPQIKWDILNHPKHKLHARLGVLMAWPDAGVVDPVGTILREDGNEITDDVINYHGGKPGDYYGTEVDFQLEWNCRKFFTWTIEGAVLIPGNALQDEHGHAVNSFMLENRFAFNY